MSVSSSRNYHSPRAVAPMLSKPCAPFDKSERKRAHTSALFYSECSVRGIKPVEADTAAKEAQGMYDKWWVDTRANQTIQSPLVDPSSCCHVNKWRKLSSDYSVGVVSITSSNESMNSQNGDDHSIIKRGEYENMPINQISTLQAEKSHIEHVKQKLIGDLKASGGSVDTRDFLDCLEFLSAYYKSKSWDGRGISKGSGPFSLQGSWLTLSKPTFSDCKGCNEYSARKR